MHPLLWLMLHNYRNVLQRRLRTLRSSGRLLAFLRIVGGLLVLARQREAAEQLVDRNLRPSTAQSTPTPPRGPLGRSRSRLRPCCLP